MANLATMLIGFERLMAGVHRKSAQVGDHRIAYSEGGKGEPVVLVHGFSASGDSWNQISAQLTKRYHVIAPDLPGWGESTRIDSASYAYPAQVERLHQFLQQLGLTRFHLVGHSMGGFSASGDSWNQISAQLTKRYHVIAPDLPGWGESTRIDTASYAYPAQVERLHQFLQQLGLTRFHLVGHSMGGFISSAYAARYPDEVITLGLIAPHGITEPEQSDLARAVGQGDNWLVVNSEQGFERLMQNLFVKRPYIPRAVTKYLAQITISRAAKTQRIFDELQTNNPPLVERLSQIKAPTFIIWGDQDKLIHVSAAEVFHKGISGSEVLIMKQTGHMPLLENVKQCSSAYMAFLQKPRSAKEAAA